MDAWQKAKETAEKSGGGKFISLKDGDSVKGMFVGAPYTFFAIYKDKNEYQDYVPGSSPRFKINFVTTNPDTKQLEVRIFSQGSRTLKKLIKMKEKYGLNRVFEISREGSSKDDTEYHILPEDKVDDKTMERINALELNELAQNSVAPDSSQTPSMDDDDPGFDPDDDLPF